MLCMLYMIGYLQKTYGWLWFHRDFNMIFSPCIYVIDLCAACKILSTLITIWIGCVYLEWRLGNYGVGGINLFMVLSLVARLIWYKILSYSVKKFEGLTQHYSAKVWIKLRLGSYGNLLLGHGLSLIQMGLWRDWGLPALEVSFVIIVVPFVQASTLTLVIALSWKQNYEGCFMALKWLGREDFECYRLKWTIFIWFNSWATLLILQMPTLLYYEVLKIF